MKTNRFPQHNTVLVCHSIHTFLLPSVKGILEPVQNKNTH